MLLLATSHALPQFPRASLQPLDAEPGGIAISALLAPLWERTSLADQRRAGLLGGRNHDTTWAAAGPGGGEDGAARSGRRGGGAVGVGRIEGESGERRRAILDL